MASGEASSRDSAAGREGGSTAAPLAARPGSDQPAQAATRPTSEPAAQPAADPATQPVTRSGGSAGVGERESPDGAITDRTAVVSGRTPGPFTPRQLARLDEALTMASRETGIDFSVYVGELEEPTRRHAERLHAGLGDKAPNGVLLAVSPGQRVLHIVTGEHSSRRLPDRSAALAALSMRAAFSVGDLVGGIVNGLRMLSDQAGHTARTRPR